MKYQELNEGGRAWPRCAPDGRRRQGTGPHRLGFHCCRADADLMTIMHQGRNTGQQELSSLDRRLSAAESALAVAQEAIAGLRNRVAELGTRR